MRGRNAGRSKCRPGGGPGPGFRRKARCPAGWLGSTPARGALASGLDPVGDKIVGQDHHLPDRRMRGLCLRQGACLYRSSSPSEGRGRRSGAPGCGARAAGDCLCDQAAPRARPGRAGRRGSGGNCPGGRRQFGDSIEGGERDRPGSAPGRPGPWARRQGHWPFNSWGTKPLVAGTAAATAGTLDPSARQVTAGAGSAGERLFEGASLERAGLEAAGYNKSLSGRGTRGRLVRRNIAEARWPFHPLVPRRHAGCGAGRRRRTAPGHRGRFETSTNELGLDHNETPRHGWHRHGWPSQGWHRHVSLVMPAVARLAVARLAAIRKANTAAPPQRRRRMIRRRQR